MQPSFKVQLARWQQQLTRASGQARQRLSGLSLTALLKKKAREPLLSDEGASVRKNGATPAKGPYVPKAKATAKTAAVEVATEVAAKKATVVNRPIPAVVVTERVEMVASATLVKPFALLSTLVLVVVLSAVAVIFAAYEYRQLFHEHQSLIQQRDDLQVEWGQLLLEQSAWAANNRVEVQAIRKLDMLVPDPEQIEIVRRGN